MANILIVDDDRDILSGFECLLKTNGHTVSIATCGEKALEIYQMNKIDLIICDLKMPIMTGQSVLEAIRKQDSIIGFLMLTGYATTESAVLAIKSYADGFLEKPILDFKKFLLLINELLSGVQSRIEKKSVKLLNKDCPHEEHLTKKLLNNAGDKRLASFFNDTSNLTSQTKILCAYLKSRCKQKQIFNSYTVFTKKNNSFYIIDSSNELLDNKKICRNSHSIEMLQQCSSQTTLLLKTNLSSTCDNADENGRVEEFFILPVKVEGKDLFIKFLPHPESIFFLDLLPVITDICYFISTLNLIPELIEHKKKDTPSFAFPNIIIPQEEKRYFIHSSPPMIAVEKLIKKFAPTEMPVLITGETGTGKELVANAIHKASSRSNKPFIPINCSSFPENLLESELFGHEKGAFTGASRLKMGLLEKGDGGTVFFDEVGDMPQVMQVKLLRVIQENELRRVGSNENRKIDIRIITATNKPLKQMVLENLFREDLFYRLNPLNIHLPPLRERGEDLPQLITHFLTTFCKKYGKNNLKISEEEWEKIERYEWPGNVRELIHSVERAVVLADGEALYVLHEDHSSVPALQRIILKKQFKDAKRMHLAKFEKEYFATKLAANKENIAATAKDIGIDVKTVWRKIKQYDLR